MPKKIPSMSSEKFTKLLKKGGAVFIRQKGTSYGIFERVKGDQIYRAPVVMGKHELSRKYIKLVFRQLGFSDEEIYDLL